MAGVGGKGILLHSSFGNLLLFQDNIEFRVDSSKDILGHYSEVSCVNEK